MIPLCVDQISFCCLWRNDRPESSRWNELINVKKNLRFSDLAVFLPKAWWCRKTLILSFISTRAWRVSVGKHFPSRLDRWALFITSVMDTCLHIYFFEASRSHFSISLSCVLHSFSRLVSLTFLFCGPWQWKTRSLSALLLHEHWIDSLRGFQRQSLGRKWKQDGSLLWRLKLFLSAVMLSCLCFINFRVNTFSWLTQSPYLYNRSCKYSILSFSLCLVWRSVHFFFHQRSHTHCIQLVSNIQHLEFQHQTNKTTANVLRNYTIQRWSWDCFSDVPQIFLQHCGM